MYAAIQSSAASAARAVRLFKMISAPHGSGARGFCARVALLAALAAFALADVYSAAAQSGDKAVIAQGQAVVSGFSGATAMTPAPQGVDPVAVTFIDPAGPSARVLDLSAAGGPPQAQVIPAPKPFTATAAQVGQVFSVTLDNASPPNAYLAASSAYGLPIVLPPLDAGAPPQRLAQGAPGAAFMPGLFGPVSMQGGPGSIWRIDGASGKISLFANVTLDGAANPGPALGGLAFDPASSSLFVADRATGMIHRFGLNGAESGHFDHGVDGRKAADLPPVAFDPVHRLDIESPTFHSQDPATWAYAAVERRVFGLAVHGGRLYYAVADGLRVWSVALPPGGGFGADARIELQVPPGDVPTEISKIIFDDHGRMILAERGAPTGAFDFQALAQPAASRALRYRLLQPDGAAAATWQVEPDEYAIGFAAALRNANGGAAIGYGYRPDGALDTAACGDFLWTTGEQLRAADDPATAAELAATGPLPLNGLQGNATEAVRPANVPPLQSYFANYFDDSGNPAFRGHLGDIAIPRGCGQSALALPTPVTAIAGWPGSSDCPPDFTRSGGLCEAPRCPAGHGNGVECCPRGTAPGANGECEPMRGGNWGCPIGAESFRRLDGSIQCAWLARCPDGAQPNLRGGCERYCPPGETAWPSRKCCGYGEVGLPEGQCCPERDVHDGKCVRACLDGDIRLPDGECCPREDVRDGKCVSKVCPNGEIRLPDGECCPREDVHDGKCVSKICPNGEIRLPDGECCPSQDIHDGKCVSKVCPNGEIRLPDGDCCPRQDVRDGKCERLCPNGQPRGPDGRCAQVCKSGYHPEQGQCVIDCPPGEAPGSDNLCHRTGDNERCAPGLTPIDGACVARRPPFFRAPPRLDFRPRRPYRPFGGGNDPRFRFPGNRGGDPGFMRRHGFDGF
jgi:hypothetical protein